MQQSDELKQQVLFANEAFYLAFSQKDLAAMEALWSQRSALLCIHPGWLRLTERAEIMGSWRAILENPAQPGMDFLEPEAHDHGPIQLVTCYEALPGGICLATNGFVREDGAWKMFLHQSGACPQASGDG